MNRRDFFKAAAAAPIAAPAAIKVAFASSRANSFAVGGLLGPWSLSEISYVGEGASETIWPKDFHLTLNGIVDQECAEMRARCSLLKASAGDPDVLAQMDEHDLFERDAA